MTLLDLHTRIGELLKARVKSTAEVTLVLEPLPEGAPRYVRVDRDQLTQAVLSIAGNGLAAMNGRGQLRFEIGIEGESDAVVRLENDGPSIPEADLERIFDPFYTRSDRGTGLGLSIAERIVEAHGGFIRAENRSGGGVSFTIVLPLA